MKNKLIVFCLLVLFAALYTVISGQAHQEFKGVGFVDNELESNSILNCDFQEGKQEKKKEVTVYITKTGKKYHRGNCRYLKKSKIKISLKDACKRGYTPCKVCKPPKCPK